MIWIRRLSFFLIGAIYAAAAAFLGLFLGGGFGHGSSFYGQLPLAPVANAEWAFERGSILPIVGVLMWGAAFAASSTYTPRGVVLSGAWLVIHVASAAILLAGSPDHPDKGLLIGAYSVGPIALATLVAVRVRRKSD
jgi:hypothetical protein